MWERAELKRRAKNGLKEYYWSGFLLILIQKLVVAFAPAVGLLIPIASIFIGVMIRFLVTNILEVGMNSYFIRSTFDKRDAGIGELFYGYRQGRFTKLVVIQFFRVLFTFLWSLLLIIPGIIKHYEYYMVPYLAAEYPQKSRKEIFALSKDMMEGNKFATFVLELSFLGWFLLGAFCCGIGTLFVLPYYYATLAELYLELKKKKRELQDTEELLEEKYLEAKTKKGFLVGVHGRYSGAEIPVVPGNYICIGTNPRICNVVVSGDPSLETRVIVEFDGSSYLLTECEGIDRYGSPITEKVSMPAAGYCFKVGAGEDEFRLDVR